MRRVAVLALLAGVAGVPAPLSATSATAPAPLEQARRAAEETSFEGVLEVRWRDGATVRSERLSVQAAAGALIVVGANRVMAQPAFGRLLAHAGGGWEEMWLPSLAPAPRPDGVHKYALTESVEGTPVAGRPTQTVEIRHGGRLVERIYTDSETGLLLERDQYDPSGDVVRTLAFREVRVNPGVRPPEPPPSPARHAPKQVSADVPPTLDEGYQRMGVYKSGSVVQALYSDGLYDLSVFQQRGRLRRSELPPRGERVDVRGATGWRYPWPGGQLVVWSHGGSVFTAVSDAPAEQVLDAVRSLPGFATRELSLLNKIRRATQALIEPLA